DVAGGIPAVCLLATYFEGYAICRDGVDSVGKSKAFFRGAFLEIFATLAYRRIFSGESQICGTKMPAADSFTTDSFGAELYFPRKVRALEVTVSRVNGRPNPNGEIQSVLINPGELWKTLERRFAEYVAFLRDPRQVQLRANFKKQST